MHNARHPSTRSPYYGGVVSDVPTLCKDDVRGYIHCAGKVVALAVLVVRTQRPRSSACAWLPTCFQTSAEGDGFTKHVSFVPMFAFGQSLSFQVSALQTLLVRTFGSRPRGQDVYSMSYRISRRLSDHGFKSQPVTCFELPPSEETMLASCLGNRTIIDIRACRCAISRTPCLLEVSLPGALCEGADTADGVLSYQVQYSANVLLCRGPDWSLSRITF